MMNRLRRRAIPGTTPAAHDPVRHRPRVIGAGCCLGVLLALAGADVRAQEVPDAVPPFLSEGTAPNLIITIDDSESMRKAFFGELAWSDYSQEGKRKRWLASPDANPIYYNPEVTYQPALGADGSPLPVETDLDQVLAYPFRGDAGLDGDGNPNCAAHFVDLNAFRPVQRDKAGTTGACAPDPQFVDQLDDNGAVINAAGAENGPYWFEFDEDAGYRLDSAANPPVYVSCSTEPTDPILELFNQDQCTPCSDFETVDHNTPDPCFKLNRVQPEHVPNFVTWYKFYRTRLLTVKTVLSRVLQNLDDGVRVTYQGLADDNSEKLTGFNPGDTFFNLLVQRFRPYGDSRQEVFDWIFQLDPSSGTWLVSAHIRAGEFVSQGISLADDIDEHLDDHGGAGGSVNLTGAGGTKPSSDNMCKAKCRKNFHLMFADGDWDDFWWPQGGSRRRWPSGTGEDNTGEWIRTNWDNESFDLPTAYDSPFGDINYSPRGPYKDANFGMLADAAFYYWAVDLVDDDVAPNEVPVLITEVAEGSEPYDEVNFWNPQNDPADWQHLTLFTVSYGMDGGIEIPGEIPDTDPNTPHEDRYGTWQEYSGGSATKRSIATDGFPSCAEEPYYTAEEDLTPDDTTETVCDAPLKNLTFFMRAASKADDLYHAALNSRGRFYRASAPDSLIESFSDVLDTVSAAAQEENANAPVAINAGGLSDDSRIHQAVSSSKDWSGEIRALRVSTGYGVGNCPNEPRGAFCEDPDDPYLTTRSDGTFTPTAERTIFTMADGVPKTFDEQLFTHLSTRQKNGLTGGNPKPAVGKAYIAWLRGVDNPSTSGIPPGEVPEFRERETPLGDILGSGPIVVGSPRQLFQDSDYLAFKKKDFDSGTAGTQRRDTMVYVGANDGMLHAFRPDDDTRLLEEAFAYIPEAVYDHLADLADPAYGADGPPKRAFVDGQLSYSDAKFTDAYGESGWRSVLVGSFGVGAQGVFALDITDISPTLPTDTVLWEFTDASGDDADANDLDGRDMGYSPWKPAIVRIDDNLTDNTDPAWVVLVGNGYGSTEAEADGNLDGDGDLLNACDDDDDPSNCTISTTGNAVLYLLNLGGGNDTRIKARMDTGYGITQAGGTNGLAEVATLDENGDLIADRAYAGDFYGNVWRFNLVDTKQPPTKIFQARDPDGNPQPITSRIAFTRHPNGGYMLLFGTGQFINEADKTDDQVQTFYGIWDDGGTVYDDTKEGNMGAPARLDLIHHEFLQTKNVQDSATGVIVSRGRTSTTADSPKYEPPGVGNARGWLIDLLIRGGDKEGERVVVAPQVRRGRVVFVSMIPGDCCSAGGESWINALDALDGSRLDFTPFDFNLDGNFNKYDLLDIDGGTVGSSIRVLTDNGTGIYSAPSALNMGGGEVMSVISDSEGDLIQLEESDAFGWRTWLQLE